MRPRSALLTLLVSSAVLAACGGGGAGADNCGSLAVTAAQGQGVSAGRQASATVDGCAQPAPTAAPSVGATPVPAPVPVDPPTLPVGEVPTGGGVEPAPAPDATPAPTPTDSSPAPVPTPVEPSPAPAPTPEPAPEPTPAPTPAPVPVEPAPAPPVNPPPAPEPAPEPAPAPVPVPTPPPAPLPPAPLPPPPPPPTAVYRMAPGCEAGTAGCAVTGATAFSGVGVGLWTSGAPQSVDRTYLIDIEGAFDAEAVLVFSNPRNSSVSTPDEPVTQAWVPAEPMARFDVRGSASAVHLPDTAAKPLQNLFATGVAASAQGIETTQRAFHLDPDINHPYRQTSLVDHFTVFDPSVGQSRLIRVWVEDGYFDSSLTDWSSERIAPKDLQALRAALVGPSPEQGVLYQTTRMVGPIWGPHSTPGLLSGDEAIPVDIVLARLFALNPDVGDQGSRNWLPYSHLNPMDLYSRDARPQSNQGLVVFLNLGTFLQDGLRDTEWRISRYASLVATELTDSAMAYQHSVPEVTTPNSLNWISLTRARAVSDATMRALNYNAEYNATYQDPMWSLTRWPLTQVYGYVYEPVKANCDHLVPFEGVAPCWGDVKAGTIGTFATRHLGVGWLQSLALGAESQNTQLAIQQSLQGTALAAGGWPELFHRFAVSMVDFPVAGNPEATLLTGKIPFYGFPEYRYDLGAGSEIQLDLPASVQHQFGMSSFSHPGATMRPNSFYGSKVTGIRGTFRKAVTVPAGLSFSVVMKEREAR